MRASAWRTAKVFDVYCGLYQPDERSAELTGQTPVKMTIRFE